MISIYPNIGTGSRFKDDTFNINSVSSSNDVTAIFHNSEESHLQGLSAKLRFDFRSIKFPNIAGEIDFASGNGKLEFSFSSQLEYHYDMFLEILQIRTDSIAFNRYRVRMYKCGKMLIGGLCHASIDFVICGWSMEAKTQFGRWQMKMNSAELRKLQ